MNGNVTYNGSQLLSGAINVNTTGNIQALNVQVTENGERTITPPEGVDGYAPITIDTNVPTPEPVLDTLNVTSNGTYTPPSGVDGYDEVNVSVSGYTIKTLSTTPTPIASFTDGTSNPLKSLTASIVPVQAGSGDPSPTNVRPISGWTEEVITRGGNNIWTGESSYTRSNAGYLSVADVALPAGTYTYVAEVSEAGKGILLEVFKNNSTTTANRIYQSNGVDTVIGANSFTFTLSEAGTNLRIYTNSASGITLNNIKLLSNPTTTTIPFTDGQGQSVEVFGGSVDIVNGGGSAYKEYDSYNGETLVGPWISDRDVYVPNTSPTIGAQVVDMGDTTTFYTQPTSIKSLDGENNVFASTGDVEELKYFADL